MALEVHIAGAYLGTYNAVAVAYTKEGFELTQESKGEEINATDQYGDSILDIIYRGGNVTLGFESKIYKAGTVTPFWPWAALGQMATTALPVGRTAQSVALSMVLTSTPATTAVATPATLTAPKSILKANSNLKLLYTSKCRDVPIQLQCLPSEAGGTVSWFTQT